MVSDNKRIAVNTVFLYIRTFLVLAVSLFSTRILFQALGETNLGIYNVVGGVVALMTFLQAALTVSTGRFITYELGRNQDGNPQSIYAICFTVHFLVAIIALIAGETVGLYIVNNWTSIPLERMPAANIVYQFSLASFCLNLFRVPLNAVIIAHERMSVFAYMSILEVVLQFTVAYAVLKMAGDALVNYASLHFGVFVILFAVYWLYVRIRMQQYKMKWLWDASKSKEILFFSGWTLLGSTTNTITQQGVSLLMNNFVGLVANTALGFANQVQGAVSKFVNSFTTAFNPQLIKISAQNDKQRLHLLMYRASKFSFVLAYAMALPIIANMHFLLNLWLGSVPIYTTEFCQLILVCSVISATTGPYNTAITASGNIRNYQLFISFSFLLDLICAFLMLMAHLNPVLVFGSRIMTRGVLNMFIGLHSCKVQIDFDIKDYSRNVLLPIVLTIFLSIPLVVTVECLMTNEWGRLIISSLAAEFVIVISLLWIICTKHERNKIVSFVKSKIMC